MSPKGELLGLVTSNTRHAASGRSFARINYSVAAGVLRPICEVLRDGVGEVEGVRSSLAALEARSAELGGVWGLQAAPGVLGGGRGSQGAARLSELLQGSGLVPSKL